MAQARPTVDALNIASKEQRTPCKFPWFVVDLLAIFRASTVAPPSAGAQFSIRHRETQSMFKVVQNEIRACGKWKQGLKPAVPWWFNFDPYPYIVVGIHAQ